MADRTSAITTFHPVPPEEKSTHFVPQITDYYNNISFLLFHELSPDIMALHYFGYVGWYAEDRKSTFHR